MKRFQIHAFNKHLPVIGKQTFSQIFFLNQAYHKKEQLHIECWSNEQILSTCMCKIMCYTRHSSFLICQQERLQRTFCVSCFTVDALGLTCPSRLTCPSECSSWLWFFYWLLLQRKRQNNLKAFWGLHNWKKQMILRT